MYIFCPFIWDTFQYTTIFTTLAPLCIKSCSTSLTLLQMIYIHSKNINLFKWWHGFCKKNRIILLEESISSLIFFPIITSSFNHHIIRTKQWYILTYISHCFFQLHNAPKELPISIVFVSSMPSHCLATLNPCKYFLEWRFQVQYKNNLLWNVQSRYWELKLSI